MKLLIKNYTLIIFDDNNDGKYPSEIFNVISDGICFPSNYANIIKIIKKINKYYIDDSIGIWLVIICQWTY